jgi:3-dehydroquinate synthase
VDAQAQILTVELADRSYDIHIGAGLLDGCGATIAAVSRSSRAFIVTDDTVAPLYLARLEQSLHTAGMTSHSHTLPAGEQAKSWDHLGALLDAMLAVRSERGTMVVALGGGVIGDLAGFAASILLRGVDFVQVPTTILSQVDSSVGGKTGINVRQGKNLLGTFHQPRLVIADTDVLRTLPQREILAGYAEVAKYGLIDDPALWDWLEQDGGAQIAALDPQALQRAIHASCRAKARVVASDEKENGVRALLNLGHTFAHALEAEGGYGGPLLHGEAVAVGMVMAFDLSVRMGLCPPDDAQRVRAHLSAVGLPVSPPHINGLPMDANRLLAHMASDKKVSEGKITFVLANGIGQAFLCPTVPPADVLATLQAAVTGC